MIIQVLHCPCCQGTNIVWHGKSPEDKQRYRCRECLEGQGRTFLLAYSYAGQSPAVKEQTQKIESKHITLRTRIKRLVRRTICFSKTAQIHDLIIGLFINRYEFGRLP